MPGFELWSDKERKEVNDVLETGILMRYGFDGPRKGIWKSKELEEAICKRFGCDYAQLTSSGTAALTTAMSALGIGYGDEVINSGSRCSEESHYSQNKSNNASAYVRQHGRYGCITCYL